MKKRFMRFTAIAVAFSLMLTGCSLTGKKDNSDDHSGTSGKITDDSSLTAEADNAASEASSLDILVAEDLSEPDLEEIPSTESSAPEAEEVPNDIPDEIREKFNIDENLVMVFFGDSQIANGTSDGTDIPSLVAQKVPYSKAYNLAIGGTTAALEIGSDVTEDYDKWTSNCFLGMVKALEGTADRNRVLEGHPELLNTMNQINPSEVDYYFIEYGANDFFNKVPLDIYSTSDESVYETQTYYGALSRGIEKLQALSPDATIVLISPFYAVYFAGDGSYIGDSYITSNGLATLQDYAKKMTNIAEEKGLYILDTMFRSKFDLYLDTYSQYLMDNLHLSLTGRQIVARFVAHVPNTMEGYEPMCFRTTDFVIISQFDPDYYYKVDEELFKTDYPDEYQRYLNGEYLLAQPE
ncbi:MAG: SGNH/GDSL hydrolase family protein [Butyrivibrio sp.]|nr:SGNH/GDSL hydrolase family protein [Butyrivibrio sp.]